MSKPALWCADGWLSDPEDRVRRYCGLEWSGGEPETWAFQYFDRIPVGDPTQVEPVDVVACSALHPGIARDDLAYFDRHADDFVRWLGDLPNDVDLGDADDALVAKVSDLVVLSGTVGLSLLSKVAHRKRPRLVPMFDRAIVERYRRVTGQRGEQAWPSMVAAIQADLADDRNDPLLAKTSATVQAELGTTVPSSLRVLDIAIWMDSVR
jgi:hypothetical protein